MNVIVKPRFTCVPLVPPPNRKVGPVDVEVELSGVFNGPFGPCKVTIDEGTWLRLCGLYSTSNWAATRIISTAGRERGDWAKVITVELPRNQGMVDFWRDGNKRRCQYSHGGIRLGRFNWVMPGVPIGKIAGKPRKKHPKPAVL